MSVSNENTSYHIAPYVFLGPIVSEHPEIALVAQINQTKLESLTNEEKEEYLEKTCSFQVIEDCFNKFCANDSFPTMRRCLRAFSFKDTDIALIRREISDFFWVAKAWYSTITCLSKNIKLMEDLIEMNNKIVSVLQKIEDPSSVVYVSIYDNNSSSEELIKESNKWFFSLYSEINVICKYYQSQSGYFKTY